MLGKRCVNCEIIEADGRGNSPDEDGFDESSRSLLDVIVEKNDKVCKCVNALIFLDYLCLVYIYIEATCMNCTRD